VTNYRDMNRLNWNDRTAVHAKSKFYNIDAFLAGKSSLSGLDQAELGDVADRTMLHLQCHFGKDSLSWARAGAHVTGVDISEDAIALAQSLNEKLGLDARFLRSDDTMGRVDQLILKAGRDILYGRTSSYYLYL
jgi:2-polyprenyl-3-methyl-5-hydroxy-6-metoxy-1,4-benzoquinol methylase